jgi:uncharacterized protein (DUF885 family)
MGGRPAPFDLKVRRGENIDRPGAPRWSRPGPACLDEFPDPALRITHLPAAGGRAEFLPGIRVPVNPFCGVIGWSRADEGQPAWPARYAPSMADAPKLPNEIADELKAHRTEFDLESALWNGDVANLERWPDWSATGIDANIAGLLDIARRADAVQTTGTLEQNLVEAVAFSARADAAILEIRPQLRALNPAFGLLSEMHAFLPRFPLVTADHGARYHEKLRAFPAFVDRWSERLQAAVPVGDVPIRHLVQEQIGLVDEMLSTPLFAGPLGQQAAPTQLDESAAVAWTATMHRLLDTDVAAGLAALRATLVEHTLPAAMPDDRPGLLHLPGGVDRYALQLWASTSLDITPKEVHRIGIEQVARLEDEYRQIAGPVAGTRDVAEIMRRLRDDPDLHYHDTETLIADAEAALARATAAAPDWFGVLPRATCTAHPTRRGSLGMYSGPAADGTKQGELFVNVADPTMWGTFLLAAFTFHEGIPGHHLQVALSKELPDVHSILSEDLVSSYSEGWGLYAERLADEMGLYLTDLDRIGMLAGDSIRACRLVVDTGIHALGWTRDQGIAYLLANAPVSLGQAINETDRSIGMPGQACSYMLGRIAIDQIRADAAARIGNRFDIRAFHDQILRTGSIPLGALRRAIGEWAEREVRR